jgi:hypothetical protein
MAMFSPSGDTLWSRILTDSSRDWDAETVCTSPEGDFVISGSLYGYDLGASYILLVKTNVNGDILWASGFLGPYSSYCYSIAPALDDGYIISGAAGADPRHPLVLLGKLSTDVVHIHQQEPGLIPSRIRLLPSFPNPFNSIVSLRYELPSTAVVHLEIYDILGRRMDLVDEGQLPAGPHQIDWNAGANASGIYYYRVLADGRGAGGRMMLLK